MPTVDVFDQTRQKVETLELPDDIFNVEVRPEVLHSVVRWQLAKRRAGTAKAKSRHEVSGGGRKPWRQKGTGRARSGTTRSPLWRHGGVIHGPLPRDYDYKLNKKVRRLGLRMALSAKLKDEKLVVLSALELGEIKTKVFAGVMKNLQVGKALFVAAEPDEKLALSCRNIPGVKLIRPEGLNVYDIMNHDHLILVKPSIPAIVERLQ